MTLDGKVALVSGAARGIGRAIARELAREGARVAAVDILEAVNETARSIADETGARTLGGVADVSDPEAIRSAVGQIRETLGDVDILVNNAGLVANIARFREMETAAWERELRVNLGSQFHLTRAVIDSMIERRWGRIINFSSIAALGGLDRQVGYAASKAGVIGLTHTVALEHGRDGVTCNAILPGLVRTETVDAMPQELRDAMVRGIPVGRIGEMHEVARLVVFLASEEAGYINGAEIRIDGGARLNQGTLGSRRELRRQAGES